MIRHSAARPASAAATTAATTRSARAEKGTPPAVIASIPGGEIHAPCQRRVGGRPRRPARGRSVTLVRKTTKEALSRPRAVGVNLFVRLKHDPAVAMELELYGLSAAAPHQRLERYVRDDVRRQ